MPKNKTSLVFFGNERLATGVSTTAPTLRALIDAGYVVKAVVSNYERGTSRSARDLEIKEIAEQHNIPVLLPDNPRDISDQLKSFGAEIAILVAYGKIVPQSIIDIFPKGIINIHPSLLPTHRGPTPIESVILDGSIETGVSIMKLVKAMDAGPVYGQVKINLTKSETKQQLADRLLDAGGKLLVELLPEILDGTIAGKPQNDDNATYDKTITKLDGAIDWNEPAEQIEREIRAYAGWPKSFCKLGPVEVVITKAYAVPTNSPGSKPGELILVPETKSLGVETKKGTLYIEKQIPFGKNEMDITGFLAGYKSRLSLDQ
jgi:methionyl-tRNA formyltransferase